MDTTGSWVSRKPTYEFKKRLGLVHIYGVRLELQNTGRLVSFAEYISMERSSIY
jgi:hypothetical protein